MAGQAEIKTLPHLWTQWGLLILAGRLEQYPAMAAWRNWKLRRKGLPQYRDESIHKKGN
jgi:hypothetical protein